MVIEKKKIWIYIAIAVFIFIAIAFLGYYFRANIKAEFAKIFNKSELGNLPANLIGPKRETRASQLDPNQVIYWTNYYRKQNGLKELTYNKLLATAAQAKTDDMFSKQYFEHDSPAGVTPAQLVSSVGYNYKVTGENLALGDFLSEKDLVDAWMNSPGHRANILNKDYTEIGVATGLNNFQDRNITWIAVQEFGEPQPNCTLPEANLKNTITSQKSELDSINSQITTLSNAAANLNNQANQQISQGNEIYAQTHDRSQAQPYWDQGAALQAQAKNDLAQAQILQTQAQQLSSNINSESSTYNSQVNAYNGCISG